MEKTEIQDKELLSEIICCDIGGYSRINNKIDYFRVPGGVMIDIILSNYPTLFIPISELERDLKQQKDEEE
jgi:hypothetical protein